MGIWNVTWKRALTSIRAIHKRINCFNSLKVTFFCVLYVCLYIFRHSLRFLLLFTSYWHELTTGSGTTLLNHVITVYTNCKYAIEFQIIFGNFIERLKMNSYIYAIEFPLLVIFTVGEQRSMRSSYKSIQKISNFRWCSANKIFDSTKFSLYFFHININQSLH